jgi:hypothetical protein
MSESFFIKMETTAQIDLAISFLPGEISPLSLLAGVVDVVPRPGVKN